MSARRARVVAPHSEDVATMKATRAARSGDSSAKSRASSVRVRKRERGL